MDRLFVPLQAEPYEDFKYNGKTYELRGCSRNYKQEFVYTGRRAELRKGYSGESIWGKIGDVVVANTLKGIFDKIDFKKIEPRANTKKQAIEEIIKQMGKKEKYIAFEVKLVK